MSAIIGSLSEFLALLGQSFNLAAIFPAFVFVLLNYILARALLGETEFFMSIASLGSFTKVTIFVVIVVALGYFLSAMNDLIIRFLEGYPVKNAFPFDVYQENNAKRLSLIRKRIVDIPGSIRALDAKRPKTLIKDRPELWKQRTALQHEQNALIGESLLLYPMNDWRILPTRLGNAIAAAEDFPQQLFGIDSVTLWPYIGPVLTETGYAKFVEHEKSKFDLFVNGLLLCGLFGLEFIYAETFINGLTWRVPVAFFLTSITIWSLYRFAVQGAIGWGMTIRASFVLHRDKLREALGLVSPNSYQTEHDLWEKASEFYREPLSAPNLGKTLFDYDPPKSQPEP